MLAQVHAAVDPLRSVLESGDWKRLKSALHKIPTRANTPRAVETIRVATDVLIEECAFSTAFERAFVARRALHNVDIAKWIYSALTAVHPSSLVARRLVTLIESLSTTETGRTRLGRARIINALINVWRRAGPRGSHVPAALCALCSGHIDNISRVMRYGGVEVAEYAIRATVENAEELESEQRRGLQCTLLLLGLLTICIPDKRSNTELVPLVRQVVAVCLKLRERNALTHALNIIGNITECWRKEGRGFSIIDVDNLAADIVQAWTQFSRSRNVVGAAAWAITGLIRTSKLVQIPAQLDEVLERSSKSNASVRALRSAVADFRKAAADAPIMDNLLSSDDTYVDSVIESNDLEVALDFNATCGAKRRREVDEEIPISKRLRTRYYTRVSPQRPAEKCDPLDIPAPTPTRPQDMDFDEEPVPLETVPKKNRRRAARRLPANYSRVRA